MTHGREQVTRGRERVARGREQVTRGWERVTRGREPVTHGQEQVTREQAEGICVWERVACDVEFLKEVSLLGLCRRAGAVCCPLIVDRDLS